MRDGHGAPHGHHAHALDASGNDQILCPGKYALRGEVDRLLRGAALPVDGHAWHVLRQAGRQPGVPRDVNRLRADLRDAAHDHIFDRRRVDPGACDQFPQHVRCEVGGVDRREATVPLANGASNRPDDVCLRHDATSMTHAAPPPACPRGGMRTLTFAVTLRLPRRLASAIAPAWVLSSVDYRARSCSRTATIRECGTPGSRG